MASQDFKFDFFISYKHADPDTDTANYIRKLLEKYKIPKEIQKRTGKKRIARVFRDKEELSVSADLAAEIREQLRNSEYLIVICSPNSRASRWVESEIKTFMEVRGSEYILPVLIEGEPEDAFPLPLLATEPMAADCRGNSKKEIHKRCRSELLRLIAPALQCSYDDLKQRHKVYKMRRFTLLASIITLAVFVFGAFSLFQSIQITANYREKLINQAKLLADRSEQLLESGDRETALLVAMAALPDSENDQSKPLVGDAELALEKALNLYTSPSDLGFFPNKILSMNDSGSYCDIDEENRILASRDCQDMFYFWDLKTKTLIASHKFKSDNYENLFLLNKDQAVACYSDKVTCFNFRTGKTVWEWKSDSQTFSASNFALSPKKDILAFGDSESETNQLKVYFLRMEDGIVSSSVSHISPDESNEHISEIIWNPNNKQICVKTTENLLDGTERLYLVNTTYNKFELLSQRHYDSCECTTIAFQDENTLIYFYGPESNTPTYITYPYCEYSVTAYNCSNKEKIWQVDNTAVQRDGSNWNDGTLQEGSYGINFVEVTDNNEKPQKLVTVIAFSEVINILNGEVLTETGYDTCISSVFQCGSIQLHLTNDGILHPIYLPDGDVYGETILGVNNLDKAFMLSNDTVITFQNGNKSNKIYCFTKENENYSLPLDKSEPISTVSDRALSYSDSNEYIIGFENPDIDKNEQVSLWKSKTGEKIWEEKIGDNESIRIIGFFGNQYCFYTTGSKIVLYSLKENKVCSTYRTDEFSHLDSIYSCSATNDPCFYFTCSSLKGINKVSGKTLKTTTILTQEQISDLLPHAQKDVSGDIKFCFYPSPNGHFIALQSISGYEEDQSKSDNKENPLVIWDCVNKKILKIPQILMSNALYYEDLSKNCVFSEDGTLLLAYDNKQTLHILNLEDGSEITSLHIDGDSYHKFWISTDKRYVFLHSSDYQLKAYDLKAKEYTMTTNAFSYKIESVDFYDDDQYMIIQSIRNPNRVFIQTVCRKIEDGVYEPYSATNSALGFNMENVLISTIGEPIYQQKRLSLDGMLEQAKEILNGRELTDIEKQEYHIDD